MPCAVPGVYLVEAPVPMEQAPLDHEALAAWIGRVATLRLDGRRPSTDEIADRLSAFWIPGEMVVYVGSAGTSVAKRVGQFHRTPLGDSGRHAGGHWLKTLADLDQFRVWWAETDQPEASEAALLERFAQRHGDDLILPFANRQTAGGVRKPHGITGSTLAARRSRAPSPVGATGRPAPARIREAQASGRPDVASINTALQRLACSRQENEIRAVDAAAELDRMGLLRDSPSRPGRPLRDLLRAGQIGHAHQDGGRFWFVRCGARDPS